ncbi:hypothetical protein diail_5041 [Diaporthe ilicicola]|nr:hypothetical protein diail_5041 [Diaporthe ilicicola]
MAELVGLVSGIATLAAAGFQVARKISAVADDLGTAGAQVRSIGIDTKAVAMILRDIEAKLLSGKDSSREMNEDTRDVLAEVIELCRHEINDLNENLAPLKDDDRRGDMAYLKQKARWLFDKPKVAARQASLDSLKLTLSLLVHNVQLFDGESLREPPIDSHIPLLRETRPNTTVVLVNRTDEVEPPPEYQVTNEHNWQDESKVNRSSFALEEIEAETEMKLASLSLSEAEAW